MPESPSKKRKSQNGVRTSTGGRKKKRKRKSRKSTGKGQTTAASDGQTKGK